jgi:hypothetical protein
MHGFATARRFRAACHGADQMVTGLSMSTASLTGLPSEERLLSAVPYCTAPYQPKTLDLADPRQSGAISASKHLGGSFDIGGSVNYVNGTFWRKGGGLINDFVRSDLQSEKALWSGAKTGHLAMLVQEVGRGYEEFSSLSRCDSQYLTRLDLSID